MMNLVIAPLDIHTGKLPTIFNQVFVPKAHLMGWTELDIVPYNKARVIPRALVRNSSEFGWVLEDNKTENVFIW